LRSKKIILLLGPTGVGKTALSLLLARYLNTEIISSDSMQVYKHMDIGTAKPTEEEKRYVKHHMIDIVEPWQSYSAGAYIKAVKPIIKKLIEDEKIPLVVGGTGLYIRAMTQGIFEGPSADWDLRKSLINKERESPGYIYNLLKTLDPYYASKVMHTDLRRITRALEVCLRSNKSFSELHRDFTIPLPYNFVKIGIKRNRKELYDLINKRVDRMIESGLVDEVRGIINMIKEHSKTTDIFSLSSMQAIGYKEIAKHLYGEFNLYEAIRLIKKRSRNYAKRQFTWFKKEEGINWIDISGIFDPDEIFLIVKKFLESVFENP
jgi:tRNA dimethylallyltransferase